MPEPTAPQSRPQPGPHDPGPGPAAHRVRLLPDGREFTAREGQPLLQAAADAGFKLPSACRNGTCRACMSLCVDGRVRHLVEWPGLSAEEKAQGMVLPCVACAESDLLLRPPRAAWQPVPVSVSEDPP